MKKLFLLIFILTLSGGVGKGLYYAKKGFSPRRIHVLPNPISDQWGPEAELALSQPFRYLGRGRQCFAFESEDGKYVVKLPRTDIYKIPLWLRALPLKAYREQLQAERAEREEFITNSMQIAFDELKEQTAILAIHLGQSAPKGKILTLIDALGSKYRLPLHKTPFVLQYRQPLLMKAFQAALQRGDRKEAERILDALIAVVVERGQKGILNRDRSFLRNYGFDGEKAYQIDIGSFFRMEELPQNEAYQKSVRDSMDAVKEWMAKTDPEMVPCIDQKLKSYDQITRRFF